MLNLSGTTLFFLGGGIGLLCSLVAGWVDYRRRRSPMRDGPPFVLVMAGFLGLSGLGATALSMLFTDSVRLALVTGVGVSVGCMLGFGLMAAVIVWRGR